MGVGRTLKRSDKVSYLNNPKNSSPTEILNHCQIVCKSQDRGRNDEATEL